MKEKAHVILCGRPDSQLTIFDREAVKKAWEEFKKHGDHTIYFNFDKTKPVGRILIDKCSIDDLGLKIVAEVDEEKAKGLGIEGLILEKKIIPVQKIEDFELYGISATDKPLPENTFEEDT